MKRKFYNNLPVKLLILLFFQSVLLSSQNSIIIQPGPEEGKDVRVWSLEPANNYDYYKYTKLNAWTWNGEFGIERSFIEFDLHDIPPGVEIEEALLSLYYHHIVGNPEQTHYGGNKFFIQRTTSDWIENEVTWVNQPGLTTQNQIEVPPSVDPQQDYLEIDVTAMLLDAINNTSDSTFGMGFELEVEETYRRVALSSSDHPNPNVWPKLEIFYSCFVDLGNDTTLCEGDTLILSTGPGFTSYLWSDESTDSTLSVTTSGTYWVEVSDGYDCIASDTILIEFVPNPDSLLNLGPDTTLCFGEFLLLNTGSGFDTCVWQNGETSPEFYVNQPGTYFVTATNQCGETSDTIVVNYYPEMEIDLGNDTTLCNGQTLWVSPGLGYKYYLWQDGSISNDLLVNGSGLYSVEVTDYNNCVDEDEILVTYLDVDVNLGPDTSICENSGFILTTNNSYGGIHWNDSIAEEQIGINQAGIYWVEVYDSIGQKYCFGYDTIIIQFKESPSLESILPGYSLCLNDSVTISAPVGDSFTYFWSTGSSNNEVTLKNPGNYYLTILNECDTVSTSFEVTHLPEPNPQILADTINEGRIIHLSLSEFYESYLWSDGSNASSIEVDHNGIFYVTVKNEYNCYGLDSITINPFDCITFVPTVFTPNYDYSNDLFFVDAANVHKFHIKILNRWGELVFESSDKNFKWDGSSNGNLCAEGTYFWIINYNCSKLSGDISQRLLKGNLTLLR